MQNDVKRAAPVQGYQKLLTKILLGLGVGKLPQRRYTVQKGVKHMNPPSPEVPTYQPATRMQDFRQLLERTRRK